MASFLRSFLWKWLLCSGLLCLVACTAGNTLPGGDLPGPEAVWTAVPLDVTPLPDHSQRQQPSWVQLQAGPANPNADCFAAGCHQEMTAQAGAWIHAPFAEGQCQPCHLVAADHAANPRPHEASMRDIEICYECHSAEALGASHPVDNGLIDPLTGGLFTCTSTCHDPHTAPYEYLLRYPPGGELCSLCHLEFFNE